MAKDIRITDGCRVEKRGSCQRVSWPQGLPTLPQFSAAGVRMIKPSRAPQSGRSTQQLP